MMDIYMKTLLALTIVVFSAAAFADFRATQYLQTSSAGLNVTHTHIVNTSRESQRFTGTLYTESGSQLGPANLPLSDIATPAKARLVLSSFDIEQLFGVTAWSGPATLEITGDQSFEVLSKLTSPSGLVSNTNCVRETNVLNIEGFDSPSSSFVRLINTGDGPIAEVMGTLYDQSGNIIGNEQQLFAAQLPGKSSVWLTRDSISNSVGDTWQGEAYLEIEQASASLRLLNLNFTESTFLNFSCFESADSMEVTESVGELVPASSDATYRVTLVAQWSAASHPGAYPNGAHFSPLVAVTHNSDIDFWSTGSLATPAVESVAELGLTGQISGLIADQKSMGNALDSAIGVNLNSPGSASVVVSATDQHSLITLISMVAPSPDWFVGVNSFDLRNNGKWVPTQILDLFAYDAGTEEGMTFSLSNPDTVPQEPISAITTAPFPAGSARLGYVLFERLK